MRQSRHMLIAWTVSVLALVAGCVLLWTAQSSTAGMAMGYTAMLAAVIASSGAQKNRYPLIAGVVAAGACVAVYIGTGGQANPYAPALWQLSLWAGGYVCVGWLITLLPLPTSAQRTFARNHNESVSEDIIDTQQHAPTSETGHIDPSSGNEWLAEMLASFDSWFEQFSDTGRLRGQFDVFLRNHMQTLLGSCRVRTYRWASDNRHVISLAAADGDRQSWCSAENTLLGHVLTTGQTFVGWGTQMGQYLYELQAADDEPIQWCFAIRRDHRSVGAVAVTNVPVHTRPNMTTLKAVASLVGHLWNRIEDDIEKAQYRSTDFSTGVYHREETLRIGQQIHEQAQIDGEPFVVMLVGVEGMRALDDSGNWQRKDQLLQTIGKTVRQQVRGDDVVGRFAEDTFVLILRRLDLHLGMLIARKFLNVVGTVLAEECSDITTPTNRCVLVPCEPGGENFSSALTRGLGLLGRARRENLELVYELDGELFSPKAQQQTTNAEAD